MSYIESKRTRYNVSYVKTLLKQLKVLIFYFENNEQINIIYGKDLNSSSYMFL